MNWNITLLVLTGTALVVATISLIIAIKSSRFRKIFNSENQPDNLEEVIESITSSLKKLNNEQSNLQSQVQNIEEVLTTTFRHSAVIRFDSGGSDGGNLSFSLALLDSQQNGFIITSLHGREHNRIYCKPISAGTSPAQLSSEEQEALISALTNPQYNHPKHTKSKNKS